MHQRCCWPPSLHGLADTDSESPAIFSSGLCSRFFISGFVVRVHAFFPARAPPHRRRTTARRPPPPRSLARFPFSPTRSSFSLFLTPFFSLPHICLPHSRSLASFSPSHSFSQILTYDYARRLNFGDETARFTGGRTSMKCFKYFVSRFNVFLWLKYPFVSRERISIQGSLLALIISKNSLREIRLE